MPVRVTPQEAAEAWKTNLSGATTRIQAGINRVTEAPGRKAAMKSAKWLQAVTAAKEKFERNVGRVTLEDWKAVTLAIGVPRVAQGAQAKVGKYTAFATEFLPYLAQGVDRIANMPDMTLEDRIQKAVAMIRHNANFKRSS